MTQIQICSQQIGLKRNQCTLDWVLDLKEVWQTGCHLVYQCGHNLETLDGEVEDSCPDPRVAIL